MKGLDLVAGTAAFWVCLSAMFADGDLTRFLTLVATPAILLAILAVAALFAIGVAAVPVGLAFALACAGRHDWQGVALSLLCVAAGVTTVTFFLWG